MENVQHQCEVDVGFIRLLFRSPVEELVAHRWAKRLASLVGLRAMELRPETTLSQVLEWAAAAGADSMEPIFLIALLIHGTAGRPVLVKDELAAIDGAVIQRLRFRTTGPGSSFFRGLGRFLRAFSLHELPGIWSVVRGDLRLRDFLRMR